MEKVKIREDLELSRIAYGFMNAGIWDLGSKGLLSHIEKIMDLGITTFDHADIYGGYTCEQLFGEALKLKPKLRENMELVSKCGIQLVADNRPDTYIKHYDSSKEHILKSVDRSLENLHTDYLDVLLFHRPDPLMDYQGMADAFHQLHKEGKVKYFGVSNFSPAQFEALQSYLNLNLITNQIEISVVCLDAFRDETITQCMEQRIPPMAWSPLAGGQIFASGDEKSNRIKKVLQKLIDNGKGKTYDQVMLAWLLKHPSKIIPVIGTGKIERVESAVDSLEIEITRQEWFEIYTASTGQSVP